MMSSKSSQIGLFLSSILAVSLYFETTSVAAQCAAGESVVQNSLHIVSGGCPAVMQECRNLCQAQGRTMIEPGWCTFPLLPFNKLFSCKACCGAPPPSPPPPSPPPPPARPPGDRCYPTETSFSAIVASCATGCVRADCVRKCVAIGKSDRLAGRCISASGLCSCCCS
ncbi:hypothetical protein MKW94_029419 [Papaver nudicaule]|uniref:Uncharacterized protein n=1 Tax=Papaver nudicaule TaxID=74823 RepID=A0AA41VI17_PAPNU|nr:hypothetical protein [Papaver nudicaule]